MCVCVWYLTLIKLTLPKSRDGYEGHGHIPLLTHHFYELAEHGERPGRGVLQGPPGDGDERSGHVRRFPHFPG